MEKTFKFNCTQCTFRCNLAWQIKDHKKKRHEVKAQASEENQGTPAVSFVKLPEVYRTPNEDEIETSDEEEEEDFNKSRLRDIKRQTPGTALNKTKSFTKVIKEQHQDFICEVCKVKFFNQPELKEHHEKEHGHQTIKTVFRCSDCSKEFENKEICMEHINTMACKVELLTNLVVGGQETPLEVARDQEEEGEATGEPVAPPQVEVETKAAIPPTSTKADKVNTPCPTPTTTKELFKCDQCQRQFETFVGLCTHKRFKHGENQKRKKHQCEICKLALPTAQGLKSHMMTKHGKDEELSVKNSPPQKKLKEDVEREEKQNLLKKVEELTNYVKTLEERLKLREEENTNNKVPGEETRNQTEEVEMMSVPEFKRVKTKRKPVTINKETVEARRVEETSEQRQRFSNLNLCEDCGDVFSSELEMKVHVEAKHKTAEQTQEEIWSCKQCDFQSSSNEAFNNHCIESGHSECKYDLKCKKCKEVFSSEDELVEHRRSKHPTTKKCNDYPNCPKKEKCLYIHTEPPTEAVNNSETTPQTPQHNCYVCDNTFTTKPELNSHIKTKHRNYKPCRNFASGTCGFDTDCIYNHIILDENAQICYKCGSIETSKTLLHQHVKQNHGNIPCLRFRSGTCGYNSSCMFSHEPRASAPASAQSVPPSAPQLVQDFQQAWQPKPPDQTQVMTQIITEVMTEMIPQIIQKVNQRMQQKQ